MLFCDYKDILGSPKKGIHERRTTGDTALFDYFGTLLIAFFLSKLTNLPLVLSTILCFVLGEVFHYLFCVPTNSLTYLHMI